MSMKTKYSPSLYENCIPRRSTVAVSTLVPALNVLSTVLPDMTLRSFVRTKAGPLPGLTCWNSTTAQSWPSMLSTMPFFRSFVVAMRAGTSSCQKMGTGAGRARRRESLAAGPCEVLQRHPVAVDAVAGDDRDGVGSDHGGVPELLRPLLRVGEVHLDQRRHQLAAGVEDRVGVVRPRGRVEHDRGLLVGGGVEPVEHLALVVGLADLDVETEVSAPADTEVDELVVRRVAVDLRLSPAQPAQVRTVEHQDLHRTPARCS